MKSLVFLAVISLIFALTPEVEQEKAAFAEFQAFIQKYDKKYSSVQEYMARYRIFKKSLKKAFANDYSFETGVTQFSDMTETEFRRKYLNLNINVLNTIKFNKVTEVPPVANEESFNWVDKGVLTAVKNQGSCGSCWAFSAVGNLEGLYAIKYGTNVRFSEQQLVDCDTLDEGCNGGLMDYAFEWIQQNGGLGKESDYSYKGYKGTCKKPTAAVKVTGYDLLDYTDEEKIKDYLVATGPLAVALNANPLQWYSSGIVDMTKSQCDPDELNHGVTLVGYGTQSGKNYWIVRNSWGSSWGEKGYFRIARGKGTCGINTYVVSAQIA